MDELLHFNSQDWKLRYSEGLTLFLPRHTGIGPDKIYYSTHWTFDAADASDDEDQPRPKPLQMHIMASAPDLHDWRNLAGSGCIETSQEDETSADIENEEGEESDEAEDDLIFGPDLFVHPPDEKPEQRADGWDTQFIFGERDGYEFEFTLKATRPSERAREANREHQIKLLLGEQIPWDWEKWSWLEEGDTLSFSGRLRFDQVSCNVPINAPRPIEWARQLARREINLTETGFCRVNGGDHSSGAFKPSDGVGERGRLVILGTVDEYYLQWQEQQKKHPPQQT